MQKLIMIPILLSLFGCGKEYKIEPTELPVAHIGKPYNQILKISGGRVIDQHFEVTTNFPDEMQIIIRPIDSTQADAYNNIEIKGTPKYKGKYKINIHADFYGGGSNEIKKTYDFIVTD